MKSLNQHLNSKVVLCKKRDKSEAFCYGLFRKQCMCVETPSVQTELNYDFTVKPLKQQTNKKGGLKLRHAQFICN